MKTGFDLLASNYDFLVNIVFGDAIKKAQCTFINEMHNEGEILILGGGTGWILNAIFEKKPHVNITFIDLSSAMIRKAQADVRREFIGQVSFIQGTYLDAITNNSYDVVFTAFYLDMFRSHEVEKIMATVNSRLNYGGLWLFTDFKNSSGFSQQLLLKMMYVFFKVICRISAHELANFESAFIKNGLKKMNTKVLYHGMIESSSYTKIL